MNNTFGVYYYPVEPKRYEYLLVWMLIAITGFTYFYMHNQFYLISLLIVISIHFYHKKKFEFSKRFILICFFFFFIEILQGLVFDLRLLSILNLLSRFVFVYLIIESTGQNFIYHYVRMMYFVAWSSLIIYLSLYIEPVKNLLWNEISPLFKPVFQYDDTFIEVYEISSNIIIYTFNRSAMIPPMGIRVLFGNQVDFLSF